MINKYDENMVWSNYFLNYECMFRFINGYCYIKLKDYLNCLGRLNSYGKITNNDRSKVHTFIERLQPIPALNLNKVAGSTKCATSSIVYNQHNCPCEVKYNEEYIRLDIAELMLMAFQPTAKANEQALHTWQAFVEFIHNILYRNQQSINNLLFQMEEPFPQNDGLYSIQEPTVDYSIDSLVNSPLNINKYNKEHFINEDIELGWIILEPYKTANNQYINYNNVNDISSFKYSYTPIGYKIKTDLLSRVRIFNESLTERVNRYNTLYNK